MISKKILLLSFLILVACSQKKVIVSDQNRHTIRELASELSIDTQEQKKPFILPQSPSIDLETELMVVDSIPPDKHLHVTSTGELSYNNLWQKNLETLVRSKPIEDDQYIYIQTAKNDLLCFDKKDGKEVWRYSGMACETPPIAKSSVPIIHKGFIIAAFDSGEIVVLDKNTGSILWSDIALARNMIIGQSPQIVASPVTDGKYVYIISRLPYCAAYHIETGERAWTHEISSLKTPLLLGQYLIVVSDQGYLYAINKDTGHIRWVNKVNVCVTPVFVNGMLMTADAKGLFYLVDPVTGKTQKTIQKDIKGKLEALVISNSKLLAILAKGKEL